MTLFGPVSQRLILFMMALYGVVASRPASAQDASRETPEESADIIVTAQGREQSLQDVPVSVSVTGGAELQRGNIPTLEGLSARLPAVRVAQAPGSDQLHIRGTGSGFNPGFEQSVATFVDGIYRGRSRSVRAALFDVDRVEVLKGPQTTFFGNNAIAGAFNITTRTPGRDLEANGAVLYSPSDGEYNLEGGISAPISESLSSRVALRFSGMNGYVRNDNLGRSEPRNRDFVGRGVLAFRPSGTAKLDLRVDVGRNRDRGSFPGELLKCPPDPEFNPVRGTCAAYLAASGGNVDDVLDHRTSIGDSRFDLDFIETALRATIAVGDHELTSTTGFYEHDAVVFTNVIPAPTPSPFGPTTRQPLLHNEDFQQVSQEVRLTSPSAQTLEYMLGAYASHARNDYDVFIGFYFLPLAAAAQPFVPANSPIAVLYDTRQRDRTLSTFGSLTYNLSDNFRLNAGLRYSSVRKRANRVASAGIAGSVPDRDNFQALSPPAATLVFNSLRVSPANFPITERTDNKLMPAASAQWDISPEVMTYASYANGFKAGGYSFLSSEVFGPETVDAYELGVKSRLFGNALTINLAAFLSDYRNLQEAVNAVTPTGVLISTIGNVARSRSKGIELDASWRESNSLAVRAEVAYLDSRYVDYTQAPCTSLGNLRLGCVQNLSGKRRSFAPEFSGSAGADLTLPVGANELQISPTISFSSKYFQQPTGDPLFVQPAFAKVDLRIAFGAQDQKWEIAVIGKNLTDQTTAGFRNSVATSPGSVVALPDRPRSIAFQLTVRH